MDTEAFNPPIFPQNPIYNRFAKDRYAPCSSFAKDMGSSSTHWNLARDMHLQARSEVMNSRLLTLIVVLSCLLLCLLSCPILIFCYRKRRHREDLVKQLDLEGAHKEYALKLENGQWVPREDSKRDSGTYSNLILSKFRATPTPTSPEQPPPSPLSFSDLVPDTPSSIFVGRMPMLSPHGTMESPLLPPPCKRIPTPVGESPTLPASVANGLQTLGYSYALPAGPCASSRPRSPLPEPRVKSPVNNVVLYPAPPGRKAIARRSSNGRNIAPEHMTSPRMVKRPYQPPTLHVRTNTMSISTSPKLSPIPEKHNPNTPQRPPRAQSTSPLAKPRGLGVALSPQTPYAGTPASVYNYYTYVSRPLPPPPPASPTGTTKRVRDTEIWEDIIDDGRIGVRHTPLTFNIPTPLFTVSSPKGTTFPMPK